MLNIACLSPLKYSASTNLLLSSKEESRAVEDYEAYPLPCTAPLLTDQQLQTLYRRRLHFAVYFAVAAFFGMCFVLLSGECITTLSVSLHKRQSSTPTQSVTTSFGVDVSQDAFTSRNVSIILPLYMDPGTDNVAWQPLITAARTYPFLRITVILNPNNGPNTSTTPDLSYKSGLQKLKAASPSISFLGYVRQKFGQRDHGEIAQDVATWGTWGSLYNITMSGIFFDESPNDNVLRQLGYVDTSNKIARNTSGFTEPSFIVQNPGWLPTEQYFNQSYISSPTNVTIILEDKFTKYAQQSATFTNFIDQTKTSTNQFGLVLGSVAASASITDMQTFIRPMLMQAKSIFLTDSTSTSNMYSSFSPSWSNFVAAIASF